MTDYPKTLAKVKSVFLGIEDHGIFAFNIDFDYGSSGQGTGTYGIGNAVGGPLLKRVLETFGVRDWKDIGGQTVYALREDDSWSARVVGFETLPFDGARRLVIKEAIEEIQNANNA